MRAVNVKELKARLSQYLREVARGEVFLVTDRSRVVARLGPPAGDSQTVGAGDLLARLAALGMRPPLRAGGANDYRRTGPGSGLPTTAIDDLLAETRSETR